MTMRSLEAVVDDLERLGASEVWLIGSRANGTERQDSDWDLLVIGKANLRKRLSAQEPWTGFDLLVRARWKEGLVFVSPWNSAERRRKVLTAKSLRWKATTSDVIADYEEWKETTPGFASPRRRAARRLLPRPEPRV